MATVNPNPTTVFSVPGEELRRALKSRISRHKGEINECLEVVKSMLKDKAPEYDLLLSTSVQVMLALHREEVMTAPTRTIKAQLERAAWLQNESVELSAIERNTDINKWYSLTVDEAKRYGMT